MYLVLCSHGHVSVEAVRGGVLTCAVALAERGINPGCWIALGQGMWGSAGICAVGQC